MLCYKKYSLVIILLLVLSHGRELSFILVSCLFIHGVFNTEYLRLLFPWLKCKL